MFGNRIILISSAADICERIGIDLPTYMRMCISRLIQENGIPFSMKLGKEPENRAVAAMKADSRIAEVRKSSP